MRSLTSRPSTSSPSTSPSATPSSSAPRAGRLLGAVVTVAALGTAASAAMLGITSAYGGHSAHDAAAVAGVTAPADPAAAHPAGSDHAAAGGHNATADSAMSGMPGMQSDGLALYAVQSPLGIVVTDGAGRVIYGFEHDANNPPTSRCTGACAQEWQPVVVPKGQPLDLEGVDAKLVGQVGRDDGSSQLTLAGWPAYVNRADDGALTSVAADAHGSWFMITPQGAKVAV